MWDNLCYVCDSSHAVLLYKRQLIPNVHVTTLQMIIGWCLVSTFTALGCETAIQIFKPLRKHAYSNILNISPPKTENFQIKNSDIFHISAQNIDCGYSWEPPLRGGSYEYPQSMFFSRNKKNNVYPCKLQFYYIKVGFKGVKIIYSQTCVSGHLY